ncbi:MAG TPA: BofC C-terminal domain-containing protein [Halanaerobiales bacterium]|nr:BofC C-terminal domain-containing protein [Halanaerobiales bacterium]
MTGIKRQVFVVILVLIIVLITWNNYVQDYKLNDTNFFIPQNALSALPDEVYKYINDIEKRAEELHMNISRGKGAGFSSINYSFNRYIDFNTPLIVQVYYNRSNQLFQEVISLPASFVGLSLNELKGISGDWQIKYNGNSLLFYKKIDDLSPQDKEKLYLGIQNDRVAIFKGTPGSGELERRTDIALEKIPEDIKNRLKKGIIVNSREELFSILDGLISSINKD